MLYDKYLKILCVICATGLVCATTIVLPTDAQTAAQTGAPTDAQTIAQTGAPTDAQTIAQTGAPTDAQTVAQTGAPTDAQTVAQTGAPTDAQTLAQTGAQTNPQTSPQTGAPTDAQTARQTGAPTDAQTVARTVAQTGGTNDPATPNYTDGTVLPTLSTNGIVLECNADNMKVTIPRDKVSAGDMEGKDLQFELNNQTECKGHDNTTHIFLNTSLAECGTERNETDDEEIYTNRVINTYSNYAISRHYLVDIPLECAYNRTKRLSHKYQLTDYKVDKDLSEEGAYNFDFFIYQDNNFTIPFEHFPVGIGLDETFHFAASMLAVGNTLELSLESCKATPSDDYFDDTSYEIIEGHKAEAGDTDITCIYDADNDRNYVGVTMQTFRFVGKSDMVYLHCDLFVCGADEENSKCDGQCSDESNSRRRRDVRPDTVPPLARKRLTRGPIRVMRSASNNQWSHHILHEDNIEKDNGSTFSPWMIAMAALATIVTALAISMVVVIKKLNEVATSSQRRECLKEESVPLMADEE